MRIFKLALISAVVLFLLTFFISSLIPADVRISRAVNIKAPQNTISGLLPDLQHWHNWNELIKGLPKEKLRVSGNQLSGDSLTITITLATPDTVKTVWKNSGREIAGVFTFQQSGGETVVQWYFDFHQRWYPWEKFASINFDKQWGPLMQKSLDNLKIIVEEGQ